MRKVQISQGLAIIAAIAFVFVVQNSTFSSYSSYLLALLIVFSGIYISIKRRSKPVAQGTSLTGRASELFNGNPLELFAIISIITFIIALTNGLFSPLFFFLYFILFLLAFLCEPITVWVFLISMVLYLFPQFMSSLNTDSIIKLGSLLLIAPIAYFIAREFERRQKLAKKVESKTNEIIQEASILKSEDGTTPDEDEAIDEIIEEAKSLQEDVKDEGI